jgi:hypothetical protein
LLAGNGTKRRLIAYDEGNTLRQLGRVPEVFTKEFIERNQGRGHPSRLPVFVLGMPRSGTTLVEQILAGHPEVFGAGELPVFDISALRTGAAGEPALFPECVQGVSPGALRELGATHVGRLQGFSASAARVTDKTLQNSRFAGLIHLTLPDARLIYVRRDPVETCLSCFSILFTQGMHYTYDLAELGRYCRAYRRLMAHWRAALPPEAMMEVGYEDLVGDIEGQARRLVAFCGLSWSENCLRFYAVNRPIRTGSAIQVRQCLYRTSLRRWRPREELLGPLLAALSEAP